MLEQMGIAAKQASKHKAKSSSTLTPRMLLTREPMALAKRCLTVWH